MDYANDEDLIFCLRGVNLVISTIPGAAQLSLIEAARRARVKTFVPSEFEGSPRRREDGDAAAMASPGGRDEETSEPALQALRRAAQSGSSRPMAYTVFSCGVFYERFAPGGLAAYGVGNGRGLNLQGQYLVDVQRSAAEIVETGPDRRPVSLCMTSMFDVAKFVAAAVELDPATWESEYRMRGDLLTTRDLVGVCQQAMQSMGSEYTPLSSSPTHKSIVRVHVRAGRVASKGALSTQGVQPDIASTVRDISHHLPGMGCLGFLHLNRNAKSFLAAGNQF